MPTGACGINCDTCRLNLLGTCSTCGPGRSREAQGKIAAQQKILGAPCTILACATRNHVRYCPVDCDKFPCDEFRSGPYPYSHGYLNMQERRRGEAPQSGTGSGEAVKVPARHWEDLEQRDIEELCRNALVKNSPPMGVLVPFLKEYILVDRQNRCVCRQGHGQWESIDNPLLELLCLVYLLNAGPGPISQEMVSVQDLKSAHFFKGPHELKVGPLLERYGNDIDGFKRAAERLSGEALDLADAAYRLLPFPKVPLYYLFWKGDQEFRPNLSILFEKSVEHHLAPDAIWGLVSLVSGILLTGDIGA